MSDAENTTNESGATGEGAKIDALLEGIQPSVQQREQRIAGPPGTIYDGFDATYVQRKLSFFGKLDFVRVVSKAVNDALQEDSSITLKQLAGLGSMEELNLSTADIYLRMMVGVASHVPQLFKDIYMIALAVPAHDRNVVSQIMELPAEDDGTGGLSDDDGMAILTTFIDQNSKVMADFFREQGPKLVKQISEAIGASAPTPESSKPSSRTRRSTRKK